jgi:ferredoxin-NADP reductase
MHVTLDHIEDIASNIKTFRFRPDQPVRYTAGQFTAISLPLEQPDERGRRHWFTISSAPTEPLIGVTTKFTPAQGSTFKSALQSLKPGDELDLSDPMGDFVLPQDKTAPLLFVAGGIGITPMHSMIKWLNDTGQKRPLHLIYSVRNEAEMVFRELFEKHPMKFTPIVTEPTGSWQGETSPLTPERILDQAGSEPRTLIYIAGPEPMVETFVAELQRLGVPNHRLVTDYFPGYHTI